MFSQAGSVDKILSREGSQVGTGGSGKYPGSHSWNWADRLQNLSAGAIATRDGCAADAVASAHRGGVYPRPRIYPGCRPVDGTFVRRLNSGSSPLLSIPKGLDRCAEICGSVLLLTPSRCQIEKVGNHYCGGVAGGVL